MIMPGTSTSPVSAPVAMRVGTADLAQCGRLRRLRPDYVTHGSRIGPYHCARGAAVATARACHGVARCWQLSFANRFTASLPLQSP